MYKLKIILPYILIFIGYYLFSTFSQFKYDDFIHSKYFQVLIDMILVIGLYGAVYGINTNAFKENFKLIFSVITIGVIFKVIFVGTILFLLTDNPLSFLLATIIAQIDPVSVASLDNTKSKLTKQGKTILRAWASFDDPITVVLAISISMIILSIQTSPLSIFYTELYNLLLVFLIYIIYYFIKNKSSILLYVLLFFAFIFSIYFELFLAIAVIGLFLRPKLPFLDLLIYLLFLIVSFVIGVFINNGINLYEGVLYGVFTILAQVITTFILGRELIRCDKVRLSIAQQSGITAITLSLFLATKHDDIIPTIIVAIITINILYVIINFLTEKYFIKDKYKNQ